MSKHFTMIIVCSTFFLSCLKSNQSPNGPDENNDLIDTITLSDTLYIIDTLQMIDTLIKSDTSFVLDTIQIYDTIVVGDTSYIIDTLILDDTLLIFDTLYHIDTIVRIDTLAIIDSIFILDTLRFPDSIFIYDTISIDTIRETDSILITDTVEVHDTVIINDTIVISPTQASITTPYISGSVSSGDPDTEYSFLIKAGKCENGGSTEYRIDWDDGITSVWGTDTVHTHTWLTNGNFNISANSRCSDSTHIISSWSKPYNIFIVSGVNERHISGIRSVSEVWSPDTLYIITGNTIFEEGASLTILAGTHVQFQSGFLAVNKEFSAVGTSTDSIYFNKGNVQLRWRESEQVTYNPNGSYMQGPRFEYCSLGDGDIVVHDEDPIRYAYGFYLKNSTVKRCYSDEFFKFNTGSYIDSCNIGYISYTFNNCILKNSYIDTLIFNNYGNSSVSYCYFKRLSITGVYASPLDAISKNDIEYLLFSNNYSTGVLTANNFIGSGTYLVNSTSDINSNMTGNYWGVETTSEMDLKGPGENITTIYDFHDRGFTGGTVNYDNWLTSSVPDAGPDW